MNKKISFFLFFITLLSGTSFAQDWSVYYTPRFRHLKDVHVINPDKIVVVGGNPFNDSITYMATTNNAGVDWTFHDFFPGKQINSLFFKNNKLGICAGDNQALFKTDNTGETWQLSSWNISLNNRNVNKLFNGQYDVIYAVGGIDTVNGFLIKSIDGGNVWENIKEWPNNEITTAFSPKHNKVLVAGYAGFMQLSNDGGNTWIDCEIEEIGYVPEFTSFEFIDEDIGFACGGKRGNDSTCLILKTSNGGNSWSVCYNIVAPCLNDISMASSEIIYAVGEYGKVIKSVDAGETWEEEIIEENPEVNFYSVDFPNSHIGAISGEWGYVLIFDDGETNLPEIQTKEATNIQNESAVLNAMVNPGFTEAQMSFVYGIDENFDAEVSVGNFIGGEMQNISLTVQGLLPNEQYYYYAKIISFYGEYHGEIKSFYTGNPIPNWDFENWHTLEYQLPDGWNTMGNVEKVIDGDKVIVRLKDPPDNLNADNSGSAILNFFNVDFEDNGMVIDYIQGGMPINGKPNVLYARMKYYIEEGDSAISIVFLEKNDVLISENTYFTKGNSNGSFIDLSFDLAYSIDQVPDTIMIGFANFSPENENLVSNNYVEIDSIWFDIDNLTIPNSGFNNWISKSAEYPDSWYCDASDFIMYNEDIPKTVFKTANAYHNDFAICIKSYPIGSDTIMGEIRPFTKQGFFNVSHKHQNLEFYYKYSPDGIDTARVSVGMFKNGAQIAWGSIEITDMTSSWKKGIVGLSYQNSDIIPDSATISIISCSWESRKTSELCIDKITFDGDYIPVEEVFVKNDIFVYPNPFDKYLKISFNEFMQDQYKIEIYNSAMVLVYKTKLSKISDNQIEMDLSSLVQGVYFVKVCSDNKEKIRMLKVVKM